MSHQKLNPAWKLDLLEVKFFDACPRFSHTKKLLAARNNSKLLKKLPASKDDARREIDSLKSDLFNRKYHAAFTKLEREIHREHKHSNPAKIDPQVAQFFESKPLVRQLIESRLNKVITGCILVDKELRADPPSYIPAPVRRLLLDKSDPSNPSHFFKEHCQNSKVLNNYLSALWNKKPIKHLLDGIDWAFRSVRGNLTKQERELHASQVKLAGDDAESLSDSESEGEFHESALKRPKLSTAVESSAEEEEQYSQYDDLVAESDDQSGSDHDAPTRKKLNHTHKQPNHTQSSDQEEDDFFETNNTTDTSPHNLPQLAMGYFLGGSDDESDYDADGDKVVKEATTQRKNRRGQRARQKIWEKKYGSSAKHVQNARAKELSEREQRQKEYEERCRKRAEKLQPTGSNVAPLGERKANGTPPAISKPAETKVHPSWEAKRLAQEKIQNVKFAGKKITFD